MWDSKDRKKYWYQLNCYPRSNLKSDDQNILHQQLATERTSYIRDSSLIRQLIRDEHFIRIITELQKECLVAVGIKKPCQRFLVNTWVENYTEIVQELLESIKMLGCNMSTKLHFLHSHLDDFMEHLAVSDKTVSDSTMIWSSWKNGIKGWDEYMMTDYCWSIKSYCPKIKQSMKSYNQKFLF